MVRYHVNHGAEVNVEEGTPSEAFASGGCAAPFCRNSFVASLLRVGALSPRIRAPQVLPYCASRLSRKHPGLPPTVSAFTLLYTSNIF
jgi:hypothetical protein